MEKSPVDINLLKYYTVLCFRIYSWSEVRYFNFVDAISFRKVKTLKAIFSIKPTRKNPNPIANLWKTILLSLDNNGYEGDIKFTKKLLKMISKIKKSFQKIISHKNNENKLFFIHSI